MSVYNGIDGQALNVKQEFLDDNDDPLVPKPGYPVVKLLEKGSNAVLSSVVCTPSPTILGTWVASLAVPAMALTEKMEYVLIWRMTAIDGSKYKYTDTVQLEPKMDIRETDVVAMIGDDKFSFTIPIVFDEAAGDTGVYQIWDNNLPVITDINTLESNARLTIVRHLDKTTIVAPIPIPSIPTPLLSYAPFRASLESRLLKVDVIPSGGGVRSYTYQMWIITPQIALAMSFLEKYLNKARIENVIPELRYNDGDLMHYLERGLYLFNMVAQPSFFNGTNMRGVLLDAWLICSCYYAVSAQILAEGSLAFDFSGQGISLNVDRTPQLDGALGRLQSDIDNRIVPLKKILAKYGTIYGDGSVGDKGIDNPANVGVLSLMNAPTTRLPVFGRMFIGRRG